MGYGIHGFGFHLSMCNTDFVCPICTCPHDEKDFEKVKRKGRKEEYLKCKGCKRRLGFTFDLAGNLQVWEL